MGAINGTVWPVLLRFLLAALVLLGVGAAVGAALGSSIVPDASEPSPDPLVVQPGTPRTGTIASQSPSRSRSAPPATGAAGRAIAELIAHGRFTTIDLARFGYRRVAGNAPYPERGIV